METGCKALPRFAVAMTAPLASVILYFKTLLQFIQIKLARNLQMQVSHIKWNYTNTAMGEYAHDCSHTVVRLIVVTLFQSMITKLGQPFKL